MYAGHLVEIAGAKGFHRACRHPYTRALVAAVPRPDPQVTLPPVPVEGEPPDPAALPTGCPYHPRCPHAFDVCSIDRRPPLVEVDRNHQVACWLNGGKGLRAFVSILVAEPGSFTGVAQSERVRIMAPLSADSANRL
jgi:oligopeptide/dipeptide ABC transporter ATP-binding protein